MKFTCSTTSLNKAIQTVQRAISSKPTAPIFSGIHIIAAENILYVQAMDLNMAISCTVESKRRNCGFGQTFFGTDAQAPGRNRYHH